MREIHIKSTAEEQVEEEMANLLFSSMMDKVVLTQVEDTLGLALIELMNLKMGAV